MKIELYTILGSEYIDAFGFPSADEITYNIIIDDCGLITFNSKSKIETNTSVAYETDKSKILQTKILNELNDSTKYCVNNNATAENFISNFNPDRDEIRVQIDMAQMHTPYSLICNMYHIDKYTRNNCRIYEISAQQLIIETGYTPYFDITEITNSKRRRKRISACIAYLTTIPHL